MEETIGNVTGLESWQASGKKRQAEGEVETKQAQAEGYVEGTKDRVVGAVEGMAGSVMGDTTQEVSGWCFVSSTRLPLLTTLVPPGDTRKEKGKIQQEANKP